MLKPFAATECVEITPRDPVSVNSPANRRQYQGRYQGRQRNDVGRGPLLSRFHIRIGVEMKIGNEVRECVFQCETVRTL